MSALLRTAALAAANPVASLAVGTATWFGPSATLLAGLRAHCAPSGITVVECRDTLEPGTVKAFAGKTGKHDATANALLPALPPHLSHALLRDEPVPLKQAWKKLRFSDRITVVTTAAAIGAPRVLQAVLREHPALAHTPDGGVAGNTPLHYAALCTQEKCAGILLAHKAAPNASNPVQTSPLHDAARAGNLEIVRLLLAHGGNASAVNDYGDSMLHRCALHADSEHAERFVKVARYGMAVVRARQGAHLAQSLLNRCNKDGFNALDIAAVRQQTNLMACFVALGAEHSAKYAAAPARWSLNDVDHGEAWRKKQAAIVEGQGQAATAAA